MSRKVLISEDFLKKLLKLSGFEGRRIKLGRWVLKEEVGEVIGRKSEGKS
jgi:hypothetical protein